MAFTRPSSFSVLFSDMSDTPTTNATLMKGYFDSHGLAISSYIENTLFVAIESTNTVSCGAVNIGFGTTESSYRYVSTSTSIAQAIKTLDVALQGVALTLYEGSSLGISPTTWFPGNTLAYSSAGTWEVTNIAESSKYVVGIGGNYLHLYSSSVGLCHHYPATVSNIFNGSSEAYRLYVYELGYTIDHLLYHLAREDTIPRWEDCIWINGAESSVMVVYQASPGTFYNDNIGTYTGSSARVAERCSNGNAVRYSSSTGSFDWRYGFVYGVSGNNMYVSGPNLNISTGNEVNFQLGGKNKVRVISIPVLSTSTATAWDSAASTCLASSRNRDQYIWRYGKGYCVGFSAWTYKAGSGTTVAKVNVTIDGQYLSTYNSSAGITPSSSTTVPICLTVSSGVYTLNYGSVIDITTNGVASTPNSVGLVVRLWCVIE